MGGGLGDIRNMEGGGIPPTMSEEWGGKRDDYSIGSWDYQKILSGGTAHPHTHSHGGRWWTGWLSSYHIGSYIIFLVTISTANMAELLVDMCLMMRCGSAAVGSSETSSWVGMMLWQATLGNALWSGRQRNSRGLWIEIGNIFAPLCLRPLFFPWRVLSLPQK